MQQMEKVECMPAKMACKLIYKNRQGGLRHDFMITWIRDCCDKSVSGAFPDIGVQRVLIS